MAKKPILYGPDGQPLRAQAGIFSGSAFDAASFGRRMKNYNPTSGSVNAVLNGSLATVRRRARDQVRNVPWMRKADRSYVANVVGNGIIPIPKGGDENFRAAVKEAWDESVYEIDADGELCFYGLQALVTRAIFQSGEVLIRLIDRTSEDDLLVPFQIKVLEADHLDHTYTTHLPNGGRIVQGVEFDGNDRRVAYHLWREHPGEMIGIQSSERVRIPAAEIIHIREIMRPGQVRGVSGIASGILRMMDLMEYEDAELVRKKFAAMMMMFITSSADEDPSVLNEAEGAGTLADGSSPFEADIEPGTANYLDPGQDVKFNEPADVGGSYEPFMKMNLRAGAAATDTMYEQISGDLSGVNFSSIRWGLNEMQRIWEQFQRQTLIPMMCRRVWRGWMDRAVMAGALDAPNYAFERRKYQKAEWLPPGWPYVNPLQEAQADQVAVRAGFSSRTRVAGRRGADVQTIDQEIAEDNKRADALGLVLDSDARKVNKSGAEQSSMREPSPFKNPEPAEVED